MKSFSRGKGQSATAAAAYRAGLKIRDERTGETHDYTRRGGVVASMMLAPDGAPDWCHDPTAFWNQNEQTETRKNARVAREVEVSLPAELSAEQRQALAVDLGQMLVDRYSVAALVAVHAPDKGGDDRNHHTHILLSARQVGPDGVGARAMSEFDARQGAGKKAIQELREAVAGRINHHLALAGLGVRVDHRSLAEQARAAEAKGDLAQAAALTREPTKHQGKAATAALRRGHVLDRVRTNQQIITDNGQALAGYLRRAEAEGRLQDAPHGQHEQAKNDRIREAPTGPPAPVEVGGYTQIRNGRPVQIGGYTQKRATSTKSSAGPTPRGAQPRGPTLPRQGASPALHSTRAGSGAAAVGAPGGTTGKTKEQRAEERRAREEAALNDQQLKHIKQLAQAYIDDLIRTAERLQRPGAAAPAYAALVDAATQQPAALRWLEQRHEIAQERAAVIEKHRTLVATREKFRAQAVRRQKRLDRHERTEQPDRLHRKSRRAWAERREKLTGSLERAERRYKRALRKSDTDALKSLDDRAAALAGVMTVLEAERRQSWPLPCDRDLSALEQTPTEQPPATPAHPSVSPERPRLRPLSEATSSTDDQKKRRQRKQSRPRPPWA